MIETSKYIAQVCNQVEVAYILFTLISSFKFLQNSLDIRKVSVLSLSPLRRTISKLALFLLLVAFLVFLHISRFESRFIGCLRCGYGFLAMS